MARSNGKRRKEKQQKQNQHRIKLAARRERNPSWLDVCRQANRLVERRSYHEARNVLEEYEAAHPGQREVLMMLLAVYHELRDYGPYCAVCRRLLEEQPGDPSLQLMLAGGYLGNAQPASALRAFRRFVDRWPDDPLAAGARNAIEELAPAVDELLCELSPGGDDRLELLAMHEEMMACLAANDFAGTIRFGEQILSRCERFVPTMNNLSEAYFYAGQPDAAIGLSRRVLQEQADNVYALANLTKYLYLSGQWDAALSLAEQLRSVRPAHDDEWYKKCEALSYIGDDQAVIAVFEEARQAGAAKQQAAPAALLYHLAAAATARQGNDRLAERYWRKALKIQPGLELAEANLADAACPVSQRHGAWCFSWKGWFREESLARLSATILRPARRKDDAALTRAAKRFAAAHPELPRLVPALLDRGDPGGREFAWRFAMLLETPEMLDALRAFCLSQRGPDALRLDTAHRLARLGAQPSGPVRMWIEGQWREIELLGFEVTQEPAECGYCQQVQDWMYDGYVALRRGDGRTAEGIFKKCIEVEGETPDLLNNLALSYSLQGRQRESLALARQIHERWPDYFFGRIAMANIASRDGDWELAESYLAPLRRRKRLHVTEFGALAIASIQLLIDRGEFDGARSWLEMWKRLDPENPDRAQVEARYRGARMRGGIRRLFRRRKQ